MKRLALAAAVVLPLATPTTGCEWQNLTGAEMRAALEEAVETGQVQQLENGVIELTTDFTIGDGIEQVRQHIEDVLAACGSTTVTAMDDVTIDIDFGPASDACEYEGKSYSGQVSFVINRGSDSIDVVQTYTDLSNGTYTLSGTQDVSWSGDATPGGRVDRHIVSDLEWDGPRGHVDHTSERTMSFLDWLGGPTQRIQIDGDHDWTRDGEAWNLDVAEVEFRLVDPVPQDGSYTLTLPSGKQAGLLFNRIDDDTIEVTFTGARKEHVFHVTKSGAIMEEGA